MKLRKQDAVHYGSSNPGWYVYGFKERVWIDFIHPVSSESGQFLMTPDIARELADMLIKVAEEVDIFIKKMEDS